MLKSALQSGLATFDSKDLFPTDLEKIVRISYGLITNHAFRDGNKRVGIGALILMLDENNINIKISHKDLIGIGYAVGSGTMDYEKMLDKIKENLQEKLTLNENLFENYVDLNVNLLESKKRKKSKKRISDVKAGDPIFKSINKMKEWVKKRQKGQGYFVTYDVGNMDYNNMMFNKMHGASDIGVSNNDGIEGDVSSSDVGVGMGMGESLKVMNKKDIHFSSKVKSFINNPKYKQLIDDEEWDELFMEYAEKELSMEEQSQLVELLQSIGCDFEVLD